MGDKCGECGRPSPGYVYCRPCLAIVGARLTAAGHTLSTELGLPEPVINSTIIVEEPYGCYDATKDWIQVKDGR
jgi:hypothetical protein